MNIEWKVRKCAGKFGIEIYESKFQVSVEQIYMYNSEKLDKETEAIKDVYEKELPNLKDAPIGKAEITTAQIKRF